MSLIVRLALDNSGVRKLLPGFATETNGYKLYYELIRSLKLPQFYPDATPAAYPKQAPSESLRAYAVTYEDNLIRRACSGIFVNERYAVETFLDNLNADLRLLVHETIMRVLGDVAGNHGPITNEMYRFPGLVETVEALVLKRRKAALLGRDGDTRSLYDVQQLLDTESVRDPDDDVVVLLNGFVHALERSGESFTKATSTQFPCFYCQEAHTLVSCPTFARLLDDPRACSVMTRLIKSQGAATKGADKKMSKQTPKIVHFLGEVCPDSADVGENAAVDDDGQDFRSPSS
jgi:hypothetical protein